MRPPLPRISICVPVLGRGDLLCASVESLIKAVRGLDATIYIFDNGSDPATVRVIQSLKSCAVKIVKIFFSENHGIPYVVNVFKDLISNSCELVKMSAPEYVMLMDADAYFKKPIKPLLQLLNTHYGFAVISGHDSVEHHAHASHVLKVNKKNIQAKEKKNERMICLVMRREEFANFAPFPTYRNRDVDWEIFYWNKNSLHARSRRMLAVDWVTHLGQFDSTWHSNGVPASKKELESIVSTLRKLRLLTKARARNAKIQLVCNEGIGTHNERVERTAKLGRLG